MNKTSWVAFCISTYKRPELLKKQLHSLLGQTFSNFEIIVSDNDPDASAKKVVDEISSSKLKYFHNGENFGMIRSFNKSIERSSSEFVVMVTDDDPVDPGFLMEMNKMYKSNPGFTLYGGFLRSGRAVGAIETITADTWISELLHPRKTTWFLWSSCIIRKEAAIAVNKIPDYGSPHLADHAFIALVGALGGAMIINKSFSSLTSHDSNFSKFNFQYYVNGCKGFYEVLEPIAMKSSQPSENIRAIKLHLYNWLLVNIFSLKRYYTIISHNSVALKEIDTCAREILSFPFMEGVRVRYMLKNRIYRVKALLGKPFFR